MKLNIILILALAVISNLAHADFVNTTLSGFSTIGSAELSSVDRINSQDKGAAFQANPIQAIPGSGGNTSIVNMADTWYIYDGVKNFSHSGVQTNVSGLTAGQSYILTFYEAAANRTPAGSGNPGFTTTNVTTLVYWAISLGGGSVINSAKISIDTSKDYATSWTKVSLNITAGSANSLLTFLANSTLGVAPEPLLLLGNVSLTKTVPEPSIIWLLFSGVLVSLVGLKRRNTAV